MSVESMAIALHHSQARGTARLVLLGIANHDGDGGAWPAIATLCRYAGGVNESTVRRALAELVELGEITVEVNAGGDRRTPNDRRPNRYTVTLRCPRSCDRSAQHRPMWEGDEPPEQPNERGRTHAPPSPEGPNARGRTSAPPSLNGGAPTHGTGAHPRMNGGAPVRPEPPMNQPLTTHPPTAERERHPGNAHARATPTIGLGGRAAPRFVAPPNPGPAARPPDWRAMRDEAAETRRRAQAELDAINAEKAAERKAGVARARAELAARQQSLADSLTPASPAWQATG